MNKANSLEHKHLNNHKHNSCCEHKHNDSFEHSDNDSCCTNNHELQFLSDRSELTQTYSCC